MKKYMFLALSITVHHTQSSSYCNNPNSIFYNATERERDVMLRECYIFRIEPRRDIEPTREEDVRPQGLQRTHRFYRLTVDSINNAEPNPSIAPSEQCRSSNVDQEELQQEQISK